MEVRPAEDGFDLLGFTYPRILLRPGHDLIPEKIPVDIDAGVSGNLEEVIVLRPGIFQPGPLSKLTESSKELTKLLEILSESEEGYLYKHSVMIAIIASNVISKMEWGSKSQKESICFMAFFHDITIPDDDLCQIQTNSGLEKAEVSPELKNKVRNHAKDAKELIASYPNVPYGAESFILQHHGTKTGIGFSENPTDPNISPMAIVFKIVEEYVDVCIHPPKGGLKREEYIEHLKKIYKAGQYKKVVEALEQVLIEPPKKEEK